MSKLIALEYVQFKKDADVRLPCDDGGKATVNALVEGEVPAYVINYDPASRLISIRAHAIRRQRRGITAVDRDFEIDVPVEACSWWRRMRPKTANIIAAAEAKVVFGTEQAE